MLGVAGTTWVVCASLYYKWKKRIKRLKRAARLRNRVQLHAFAIDVLKRRPQPGDVLAPSNRRQLLQQLRLLDAWLSHSTSLYFLISEDGSGWLPIFSICLCLRSSLLRLVCSFAPHQNVVYRFEYGSSFHHAQHQCVSSQSSDTLQTCPNS